MKDKEKKDRLTGLNVTVREDVEKIEKRLSILEDKFDELISYIKEEY